MIKAIYSHLDTAILPLKNGSIENDPIFLLKLLLEFDLLLTLSKLLTVHDVDFCSEISGSVFTKNEILRYSFNFLQSHSEVSLLLIKAHVIIRNEARFRQNTSNIISTIDDLHREIVEI